MQSSKATISVNESLHSCYIDRACGANSVCLVDLVCFVYLVDLVVLVYPVGLVQPNKQDKPNKPIKRDRLTDFFSILLGICYTRAIDRILHVRRSTNEAI
jgi:hypothetical protein